MHRVLSRGAAQCAQGVVQAHRKLLGTQESPHHGKIGELQQDHADVRARDRQREPNERGEGRLHG